MSRLAEQFGERAGTGHEKALVVVVTPHQSNPACSHWLLVMMHCVGLSLPNSVGRVPLKELWDIWLCHTKYMRGGLCQ